MYSAVILSPLPASYSKPELASLFALILDRCTKVFCRLFTWQ